MDEKIISLTAGALIRGKIKSEILKYCYKKGVSCSFEEDRSWIESTYYITLEGDNLNEAISDMNEWLNKFITKLK